MQNLFKQKKLLSIILIFLVLSFILLSVFINYNPLWSFDIKMSVLLQTYHSTILDKVMLAISFFGELPYSLLMVMLIAGIFYYKKYKREALFISLILFSGLIILGIKNIINRPRPTSFYVRLVEINRFQSYPSGHVLSYVLFFGFLIILINTLENIPRSTRLIITYISIFYMLMIPFSRIYLGAHWFTDTVGGFLLGLICLFPLCYFYFKRKKITE